MGVEARRSEGLDFFFDSQMSVRRGSRSAVAAVFLCFKTLSTTEIKRRVWRKRIFSIDGVKTVFGRVQTEAHEEFARCRMITRRDAPPSIDLDNESVFDSEVPRTTINDRDPEWLFEIPNRITPMAMLPGELASQSRHFCFGRSQRCEPTFRYSTRWMTFAGMPHQVEFNCGVNSRFAFQSQVGSAHFRE